MIIINTVDAQRFSLDGIEYFKNFTPVTAGDSVRILNTYTSYIELVHPTNYANFTVDGNTYNNIADLQSALLPVIYTRDTLGGGGGATSFTTLTDTPSTYTGQANKKVVVKNDETGIEFVTDSSSSTFYVTIEDFGGIGDGLTDDSAAFQSAVNDGKPVYITKGKEFLISSQVNVTDDTFIFGGGETSVLKTTSNISIINVQGSNNTFENFTLRGNLVGLSQIGVKIHGVVGLTAVRENNIINKVRFYDLQSAGLSCKYFVGTSNGLKHEGILTTSDCIFKGCRYGILHEERSEYSIHSNCKIESCFIGINIRSGNVSFLGGSIVDCTNTGALIQSGTNDGHSNFTGTMINHNVRNVFCTHDNNYLFNSCSIYVGNIQLDGTGKTMFHACQLSMNGDTLSITNSPVQFKGCEFEHIPTTYNLTGDKPVFKDCYNQDNKMASPNQIYKELEVFTGDDTFVVPSFNSIDSIIFEETAGNSVTGGLNLGTIASGSDVISAISLSANEIKEVKDSELLKSVFSVSTDQTLHISAVISWNSSSVNMYIKLKSLN